MRSSDNHRPRLPELPQFPLHEKDVVEPQGRLSQEDFVRRCQNIRVSSFHRDRGWEYMVSRKRTIEDTKYPNYYPPYDTCFKHFKTGEEIWLYCPPEAKDLCEECREEAAVTITKLMCADEQKVRIWLGMFPPDPDAYLREWLDDPRNEAKFRYYGKAVRLLKEAREAGVAA